MWSQSFIIHLLLVRSTITIPQCTDNEPTCIFLYFCTSTLIPCESQSIGAHANFLRQMAPLAHTRSCFSLIAFSIANFVVFCICPNFSYWRSSMQQMYYLASRAQSIKLPEEYLMMASMGKRPSWSSNSSLGSAYSVGRHSPRWWRCVSIPWRHFRCVCFMSLTLCLRNAMCVIPRPQGPTSCEWLTQRVEWKWGNVNADLYISIYTTCAVVILPLSSL